MSVVEQSVEGTLPVKKTKKGKSDFPCDRLVGMVVGALAGLLVCSFIFAPLFGLIGIAKDALIAVQTEETAEATDAVNAVNNHWFVKMTNLYGGLIVNGLTRVNVGGRSISIMAELDKLADSLPALMALIPKEGEEFSMSSLPTMLNTVADSELLCATAADLLKGASEAWKNGEAYMGMEMPADGAVGELLYGVLDVLGTGSSENMSDNIKTVGKVLTVLEDRGVLTALSGTEEVDLTSVLSDASFIQDLLTPIMENDQTKELVPVVLNFGVSMLGETLSLPASASDLYNKMTADLAANLNAYPSEKEYVSAAVQIIADSGSDIDSQVSELLAKGLYASFKDNAPDVTAEQVEDFFGEVFSEETASAEPLFMFASSSVAEQQAAQIRAQIAQLDATVREGAEKLKSSKTFTTSKMTVENIKIDEKILTSMSEEELTQELTQISGVVASAVQFVSGLSAESGEITIADLDMKALGSAVDGLINSKLLGDTAEDLIVAVLNSPDIQEILPGATDTIGKTLIEGSKKGELKFENVFEATQKVAELVTVMQDGTLDESTRSARCMEAVNWLFTNMSQGTADAIKSVFTPELLMTFDADEKIASSVSVTVGVLLDEMVACADFSDEQYKKETDAIMSMFMFAMNGDYVAKDEDFFANFMQSTVALNTATKAVKELGFDPFGAKNEMSDKDYKTYCSDFKTTLKKVSDAQYTSATDKAAFKAGMIAFGSFFGVDVEKSVNDWTK